jgi:hypothetical protein
VFSWLLHINTRGHGQELITVTSGLTMLQAFTLLDSVARMALHAVCRSCHVRLHQATLDTVLDEQPLTEGVQASSLLQAISCLCPMLYTTLPLVDSARRCAADGFLLSAMR